MKKLYLSLAALPTLLLATPNAPLNLTFENLTATSVTVKWQDRAHSETGYKIFRDNLPIATVGKNITSFQDTGLIPNHEYTYIIKATDDQPNGVSVNSIKDSFGTNNEPLRFHLSHLAGGNKDWLGIFPIGATLNRANLLGWTYTGGLQNGDLAVGSIFDGHLASGNYQIVAFYNDSYTPEAVSHFAVTDALTVHTTKDIYRTDEHDIVVDITNAPTKGNNSDWLGIFKVGTPNENNSVYSWKYTNDTQAINGNGQPYGKVTLEDANLPIGNYEIRFFADNSYTLLTKSSFTVSDGKIAPTVYGQRGNVEVVKSISNGDVDNHQIYAPKDVHDAPVVIFLAGYSRDSKDNITQYTGLMDFIASQGYYVIGFSWGSYGEQNVLAKLATAKRDGLADTSRVSLVGHSIGGSFVFDYLQSIRADDYGLTKNSVMELDGWFALDMTPTQMQNLNTTSLIIQYGDADGLGNYQDPKINLGVYYMLKDDEKALLHIHANNTHSYQNGPVGDPNFIGKQDLLRPVHAFLDYTLKGTQSAKTIAMRDNHQDIRDFVESNAYDFQSYQGTYPCYRDINQDPNDILDYDYCHFDSIISNRER